MLWGGWERGEISDLGNCQVKDVNIRSHEATESSSEKDTSRVIAEEKSPCFLAKI